jgi:tetratricopeptide (TPR) repeat protein
MGGRYGMSFAAELIEKGDYEEAIVAATTEMEADKDNPEPFADRAAAYDYLERYTEAVDDLERALTLNSATPVIDQGNLDDAFFSALVGAAKLDAQASVARAVARLSRYGHRLPAGRHLQDAEDWRKRFGGELKSELDATTET